MRIVTSDGKLKCLDAKRGKCMNSKIFPISLGRVIQVITAGARSSVFFLSQKRNLLSKGNSSIHQIEFIFPSSGSSKEFGATTNFIICSGRLRESLEMKVYLLMATGEETQHDLISKYTKAVMSVSLKPLEIMVINFDQASAVTGALESIEYRQTNIIVCVGRPQYPLMENVLKATGYTADMVKDLSDSNSWDPVEAGLRMLREPIKSKERLCVWNVTMKRERKFLK